MNNINEYLRILRALRAGRSVSKEDIKYFANYHAKFDEAGYEKLKARLATDEGKKTFSDEDFDNFIEEAKKSLASDAYKEQTTAIAKEAERGKIEKTTMQGLNAILAGTDIGISLNQIEKGKQAAAQVRRPARPPVLAQDRALQQALSNAEQGTMAEPSAIQAARVGNLDAYQADLAAAKTASAGQTGAYGAYAQAASGRRERANLNLIPMADQIKAREQGRYDNLLGLKLQENQAINRSQGQFYDVDMQQYGIDKQAAQELQATGRQNLRSSLTGFAQGLPGVAGDFGTRHYDDLYNQFSAYGDKYAQDAVDARKELEARWDPRSNTNYRPKYTQDYIQAYA